MRMEAWVEALGKHYPVDSEPPSHGRLRLSQREVLGPTRLEEADAMAVLRRATLTGRPQGGESFVKRLEGMFVRKLDPKRTGRLKKAFAAAD
jgi:hypothetical protein